jgi:hypothetical protein
MWLLSPSEVTFLWRFSWVSVEIWTWFISYSGDACMVYFLEKQSCELLGLWSAVCLWSRTKLMSLSICHWVAWRISNEGENTRMNQCVVSEMHVFGDPWWSLLWLFERMINCIACVFFRWLIHMATLGDPWYFVSLFPDCATLPFNK